MKEIVMQNDEYTDKESPRDGLVRLDPIAPTKGTIMHELIIAEGNSVANLTPSGDLEQDPKIEEAARKIVLSIKSAHEKINRAKKLAEKAPNIKGSWFFGWGRQKNINQALSESGVITNEASADLATLIQESIKFTCSSLLTARKMFRALSYLALHGITDANGRIEQLSGVCTESINVIVEQAHDFISSQQNIEERQGSVERSLEQSNIHFKEKFSDFQQELDRQDERNIKHDKMLNDLHTLVERNQRSEREHREQFAKQIENELSTVSTELCKLEEKFNAVNDVNKRLFERFDEVIATIQHDLAKSNEMINLLNIRFMKVKATIMILISACALIAIAALILALMK